MRVAIKPVDDGPLDFNLKAGDIVKMYLDADPIGNQEKKSWLVVAFPDPLNSAGNPFPPSYIDLVVADMQREEYQVGQTPDANELRRARRYSIPSFRQKFSPAELVIIDDGTQQLPDGETAFGGTVLAGVVSGLFTFGDIVRK